ncbi:hypothetical protein A4G99_21400 [Haladaptatus sp. R4]|uniref:hypothetical protein n=1 Tax=Haladaptatus sp. R4 TaxID=1679489 RepID=UPI0007B4A49D|nr:hypothetical protein [Haladaptatus sp. R4]KZN26361.1 hypothetical protein A4G99_21400 [Haladaptatus sp. R4]
MIRCSQADCGWVAIAPSERAALNQYEAHLLETHVETVEAEIPDGYVQVRTEDGEWKTMRAEDAREFHD